MRVFTAVGRVALAAGVALAFVNASFIFWPLQEAGDWRLVFRPPIGASSTLYYPIVYGLIAGAFAALIWRSWRGRPDERRRLLLFAVGMSAGAAPLVVNVLLETIPAYYNFVHQPGVEQPVGAFLFGSLAVIPFLTAYSVLFDHIVDLNVVLRTAMQYALARYTVVATTALPFVALLLVIYREREQPLLAFVSGTRPLLLGATTTAGLLALRFRQRLVALLDRKYFREGYDAQLLLDRTMSDALHASSVAELESQLGSTVARALHCSVALFVKQAGAARFLRVDGTRPISETGVLVTLAGGDVIAMDVDPNDRRSPFARLPPTEQRWLLEGSFVLIVPLHAPDRTLVGLLALTSKQSGLPYSADDRRFLSAVAATVSLALDNLRLRSSASDASERAARECGTCSRLNGPDAKVCACGGVVSECPAPHVLRGIYRLDRRIGSGGMGVVYLARDINLDRPVAIKTLPAVSPEQASQLRTEARAMAAVQHPNLAVIHGVETWQGIPFLVQEYLPGGTLTDRLRSGPMAIRDALTLCSTIAEALEHLHIAGIVHRDVKPSNIGFTERGVPKLLDFGLAKLPKLADHATDNGDTRTVPRPPLFGDTAVAGGTPAYMSPEALDMAAGARPALDLWALAVVLFECVAGLRPFGGSNRDEIRSAMRSGLQHGPRHFNHHCPIPLDEFLLDALHLQPSRRPSSARAMRLQLEHLREADR